LTDTRCYLATDHEEPLLGPENFVRHILQQLTWSLSFHDATGNEHTMGSELKRFADIIRSAHSRTTQNFNGAID
jgi:hypothetical protein